MKPLSRPSQVSTGSQLLRLFVYGTLKRGFCNHDHYCQGVLTVEEATVRGRLFETSSGLPVLMVPQEDIIAFGTHDLFADVAMQASLTESYLASSSGSILEDDTGTHWRLVHGELMTFDDPIARLRAIDRLEGFHPGRFCLYYRVLVPVNVKERVLPAWLYVVSEHFDQLYEITDGIWRE